MEESSEAVETPEGFIALDKHQKDVNVQHKKFRDTERLLNKSTERADGLEKELGVLKEKDNQVIVPDAPDPYSETFADELAVRDEAIKRKAEVDAQQSIDADRQKQNEAKARNDLEEADREKVASFDKNMVAAGFDSLDVKKAADSVIELGMSNSLQDFVLEDPDGPALVMYLNENPIELEQMSSMSPYSLHNHINSEIRAKASLLKPQTSNAPDPPITLSGGGVSELKEPLLEGSKFD